MLLSTCRFPPSLVEQITQLGELRVVTRNTPATFYLGADEPRGIEYELARGFASRLGVQLRMYSVDRFQDIVPEVAMRSAHIGAAALTVTELARQRVEFGPAYQTVRHQVVYRRGNPRPTDIQDLTQGHLEIVAGSAHAGALQRARERVPELVWVEAENTSTEGLLRRVAAGDIDYAVVDSNLLELLRHFHPDVGVAFTLPDERKIAWALPKTADTSLREEVAAYFAELEASGQIEQLIERYYASSRDFDYVGARAFMRHFDTRLPRYRPLFEEAALESGTDWRLLAAIAYQESHWDPEAVSPTGVAGMMMLTEHTADIVDIENRLDPRESILGGARYLRRVLAKVPGRIQPADRMWLAVAAYNIGFGHLEDARILTQIRGGNPDKWAEVRDNLPLLSDEQWYPRVPRGYARGSVPVLYVDNVRRYYDLLLWMTADDLMLSHYAQPGDSKPAS